MKQRNVGGVLDHALMAPRETLEEKVRRLWAAEPNESVIAYLCNISVARVRAILSGASQGELL